MAGEGTRQHEFHPSGWDYSNPTVEHMEADGQLRRLTDEEVDSLLAGNSVPNPAQMLQYPNLKAFVADINNFWVPFGTPRASWYNIALRRRLIFQRFELLHPELAEALTMEREVKHMRDNPDVPGYSDSEYQLLYEAYQAMSHLVSRDDPDALAPDGVDDIYFLTR